MKTLVFDKMLWILALIIFLIPDLGCKGHEKEKTFTPGEMESYDNPKLGFSIQKPKNVKAEENGDSVSLVADGFPLVTVGLQKTNSKSGKGHQYRAGLEGGGRKRKVLSQARRPDVPV